MTRARGGAVDRRGGAVVVGVDGSEHSRLALKWAADEAALRGATLEVVYARLGRMKEHLVPGWYDPDSSELSPGEAILDEAIALVATRQPSVIVRGEVAEWPPGLILAVASRTAELLVVGARGTGGFKGLLLGSVSDQCIQYAHCPVVVVRSEAEEPVHVSADPRIVVGVDGSLGSTRALKWSLDEARRRSASVEAVFAWQYPPVYAFSKPPSEGYEAAASEITAAVSDHAARRAPDVPFTATSRFELTVPALLDACRTADLLVVGFRGHGGFHDALLGSVADQCTHHATCSVVVLRPHIAEEPTYASTWTGTAVAGDGAREGDRTRPSGQATTSASG
ncbi:MAG: universal stress protein [Acidimicrobiales bacterium]